MEKDQTKKQDRAARKNSTASQIALARRFVSYLGTGREAAKTAKEIAHEMSTNARQIAALAESARRIGFPVLAASERHPRGYFLAKSKEEVTDYSGRLFHRSSEILKTRRDLNANLSHWNFSTQQHDFEIDPEEVNPAS